MHCAGLKGSLSLSLCGAYDDTIVPLMQLHYDIPTSRRRPLSSPHLCGIIERERGRKRGVNFSSRMHASTHESNERIRVGSIKGLSQRKGRFPKSLLSVFLFPTTDDGFESSSLALSLTIMRGHLTLARSCSSRVNLNQPLSFGPQKEKT